MKQDKKVILHIDLDSYFTSVEELYDSSLKNIPVIIGGHTTRSVVSSPNYIARKYKIHAGMPVFKAQRLCPNVKVLNSNHALYLKHSKQIENILKEKYTHNLVSSSIDEWYLDATDIWNEYKSVTGIAKSIQSEILDKTKLKISIGCSYTLFLAKMATGINKPFGITVISNKDDMGKIFSLPIEKMHGVGRTKIEKLQELNIFIIKDFLYFPNQKKLFSMFGINYFYFINALQGKTENSIKSLTNRSSKSIGSSSTLVADSDDYREIKNVLMSLVKTVSRRCKEEKVCGNVIHCNIRYANWKNVSKQVKLDYFVNSEADIFQHVITLFEDIYNHNSVRLVGISVDNLIMNSNYKKQLSWDFSNI